MEPKEIDYSCLDGAFLFSAIIETESQDVTLYFTDALPEGKQWEIDGLLEHTSLQACLEWLCDNGYIPEAAIEPLGAAITKDVSESLAEEEAGLESG